MKRTIVAVILGGLSPAGGATAGDAPAPLTVPEAVKGITGRELGGHMRFLASDLMRGRDTASHETRVVAEYLSSRLAGAGAERGQDRTTGGQTYLQPLPLEVITPQLDGTSVTLVIEQNGSKRVVPCQLGVDVGFSAWGVAAAQIDAPVVFAGHGQFDPAQKIDEFDGIDVKGRFVLVFAGQRPARDNSAAAIRPAGQRRRGRFGRGGAPVADRALERGALGVLVIGTPSSDRQPSPADSQARSIVGFGEPSMTLGHAPAALPYLSLADPIRDVIIKATELEADSKPGVLENLRVQFKLAAKKESKEDYNVFGFFPGSDADKAKEVVIYSAHYDHVGVDQRGEIFNGSDDNASGTSALLEIAEAFGDGPRPARSVGFLWVTGEEKGLLGSRWFSDHVMLPEAYKIVADINLDMVSRNDGKTIGITPSERHSDYSSLVPAACAAAKEEGLTVKFDADGFFGRTDSYNFARKGIPVIFFFCGIHNDYHRPTDDVSKADFEKAARVARAAYRLGWQVAHEKDVPRKLKADAEKTADAR
jgi:Zn-dependent M28 family amino/carboxypeptidase